MKRIILYTIAMLIVMLSSCQRKRDWMRVDEQQPSAYTMPDNYCHEGHYTGQPPRYSGILITEVTLQNNVYRLIKTFSIPNEKKCFEVSGGYTRSTDGGRIVLQGDVTPSCFIIGKDILIPLDEEGNPYITTDRIFCLRRTLR